MPSALGRYACRVPLLLNGTEKSLTFCPPPAAARVPNRPRASVPDRPRHLALTPLRNPHPPLPRPYRHPPLLLFLFLPKLGELGYRLDRVGVLVDVGDREGVVACGCWRVYRDLVL